MAASGDYLWPVGRDILSVLVRYHSDITGKGTISEEATNLVLLVLPSSPARTPVDKALFTGMTSIRPLPDSHQMQA